MSDAKRAPRAQRVSVALRPDIVESAKDASEDLGISMSAWLAMAIGRAVRGHRLEREVLETVLRETLGEQMRLHLEEMEKEIGTT